MRALSIILRTGGSIALLTVMGCAQAPTASYPISPIPSQAARIWFYRDASAYDGKESRLIRLNGAVVGQSQVGDAFYRDVPPGHYHLTVDTVVTDRTQEADVDLAAGQQAYAKIMSLHGDFVDGGDEFYVWLMPAEAARAAIAGLSFQGSMASATPVGAN